MAVEVIIQFDGLCEPKNPGGYGCWGYLLWIGSKGKEVYRGGLGQHPDMTNNVAEYAALYNGLLGLSEYAKKQSLQIERITLMGDSKLVIRQISGEWNCRSIALTEWRDECLEVIEALDRPWIGVWIPREMNDAADKLSREAYNLATIGTQKEDAIDADH
jgi:ribonuclease HI